MLASVDHLVYAAPDVEAAVEALEASLGVRAAPGGRHPAEGTRNFLMALGPAAYLEIVGPDPLSPAPEQPRWFGIDGLVAPRLVGWAARVEEDLELVVARAAEVGVALGPVASGSRERADGQRLSWRFTDPRLALEGGVVPFLMAWGQTPHPALSAPRGAILEGLRGEHPEPGRVRRALAVLGPYLPVVVGGQPALIATLRTSRRVLELR